MSPKALATSLYAEAFSSRPVVLASAPGRVNLLGEHTDYNGGPVLPFAIGRRTVVAAGAGEGWRAVSALDGMVERVDLQEPRSGHWTVYLAGLIRVLQREQCAPPGAAIAVASGVPVGSGLASSAALLVGAAKVLTGLVGRRVGPAALAEFAFRAEHDEVGVACGRMDQTIAAFAKPGSALLFETGSGELQRVPLTERLWIIETGVEHRLTTAALNTRRNECEQALKLCREAGLTPRSLADLDPNQLPRLQQVLPSPWYPRARHVITETQRTRAAADALRRHDLARLGLLLLEGHQSLRVDYQSSCAEADFIVETAVHHGALGARLTGAGWGGAVVVLVSPDRAARAMAEVSEAFRREFGRAPEVWSTKAGGGARSER